MADTQAGGNGNAAGTGAASKPAGEGADGATAGVDWESADNPYKARYAGLDRQNGVLRDQVDELRTQVGSLGRLDHRLGTIEGRLGTVEELSALTLDASEAQGQAGADEYGEPDKKPGDTRLTHHQRLMQGRDAVGHQTQIGRTQARINELTRDPAIAAAIQGDSRMVDAGQLWLEGRTDWRERGKLDDAVALVESVVKEAEKRQAAATPATPAAGSGQASTKEETKPAGAGGDGANGDGEGSSQSEDGDGAGAGDKPSPRQRIRDSGVASGQAGDGSASGPAAEDMSAIELFEAGNRGEGPQRS